MGQPQRLHHLQPPGRQVHDAQAPADRPWSAAAGHGERRPVPRRAHQRAHRYRQRVLHLLRGSTPEGDRDRDRGLVQEPDQQRARQARRSTSTRRRWPARSSKHLWKAIADKTRYSLDFDTDLVIAGGREAGQRDGQDRAGEVPRRSAPGRDRRLRGRRRRTPWTRAT